MSKDTIDFTDNGGKVLRRFKIDEQTILDYLWDSGWYWTWARVKVASFIRRFRRDRRA